MKRLQRQEKVTQDSPNVSNAAPPTEEEAVRCLLEQKWAEGRLDAGAKPSGGVPSDVLLGKGPQENADDLMARAAADVRTEAEMEARELKENEAIAARLRKLQGWEGAAASQQHVEQEELTEEQQVARLMKQVSILETAARFVIIR